MDKEFERHDFFCPSCGTMYKNAGEVEYETDGTVHVEYDCDPCESRLALTYRMEEY